MLRCFFATLPGANSDDIFRDFASGRGHSFTFVSETDELMLSYFVVGYQTIIDVQIKASILMLRPSSDAKDILPSEDALSF